MPEAGFAWHVRRLPWHLRRAVKLAVPSGLLNRTLLSAPFLYRLPFVNYESNLNGVEVARLLGLLGDGGGEGSIVVECGTSRGGTAVLMARRLRSLGSATKVVAVDSFQGFDLDELEAERRQGLLPSTSNDSFTSTSLDYVQRKAAKLGLSDAITFLDGYFVDVLPTLAGARIWLAFIDCDLSRSIAYCAETLWPQVVPGGTMVFHDYTGPYFLGAKRVIDDFVRQTGVSDDSHGLVDELYWVRKPSPA